MKYWCFSFFLLLSVCGYSMPTTAPPHTINLDKIEILPNGSSELTFSLTYRDAGVDTVITQKITDTEGIITLLAIHVLLWKPRQQYADDHPDASPNACLSK
ncbi:MAG: hypothetical protein HY072_04650 [Deltaproteobacteria bacterium]|nr:hypothetical protein [Deltaproteobacteria bacterium]